MAKATPCILKNTTGETVRALVIGSGGREHALARKLAQSPLMDKVFVAPGNGGTSQCAENIDIKANDIAGLVKFALDNSMDLVVPGPELPLTLGIADAMREAGIRCFGPDKYCAQMEGSKSFAKKVMAAAGVPTASCQVFTDAAKAREFILNSDGNVVIKADGLAAGKGVIVASSREEALEAVEDMLSDNKFGAAGQTILIEEKLTGEEVSLLCFCDGLTAVPMASAQDHKAALDGDIGPNTGGMGAYSPAPVAPDAVLEDLADLAIRPILAELSRQGHPFTGVLYAGLMMTPNGPKVLEYNVRFGDPECQPLLMRLESDLAGIMLDAVGGSLGDKKIVFSDKEALGVVLAAEGYPASYPKGMPISGINEAEADRNVVVFHSGTIMEDGIIKSTGGRVLCVTALGDSLPDARSKAYAAMAKINMPHAHYRRDIGAKGIKRLEQK